MRNFSTDFLSETCLDLQGGGGCRYSDISYIGRVGPYFGVQNFEFQYFWGYQKMNIFGGMKILLVCFGVITKLV